MPGETDETIEETANFIRNSPDVDTFGVHVFQPVPGCDIWNNPTKYNYRLPDDNSFSTFHTIGKPGAKLSNDPKVMEWFDYLRNVVADRNIELQGAVG